MEEEKRKPSLDVMKQAEEIKASAIWLVKNVKCFREWKFRGGEIKIYSNRAEKNTKEGRTSDDDETEVMGLDGSWIMLNSSGVLCEVPCIMRYSDEKRSVLQLKAYPPFSPFYEEQTLDKVFVQMLWDAQFAHFWSILLSGGTSSNPENIIVHKLGDFPSDCISLSSSKGGRNKVNVALGKKLWLPLNESYNFFGQESWRNKIVDMQRRVQ